MVVASSKTEHKHNIIMNSRFIDIITLFDDAFLNDHPVIIDSCMYYVEWNEEDEAYHLTDCFDGSFSLEKDEIDKWKQDDHIISYNI